MKTTEYLERGAEAEALRVAFELLAEKEEITGSNIMDILDRIDAGEALSHLETVDRAVHAERIRADEAEADNVCDACSGTGHPISGRPCMCGGSGKMSDAVVYLREQLAKSENKLIKIGVWWSKHFEVVGGAGEEEMDAILDEANK